jgi:predicted amidohydrolase YtcJ
LGTLWFGGTIYTMKKEHETVEAVFAKDGIIHDTGGFEELKQKYQKEISEMVDIQDGIMFPGFVDSHMHLIGHGEKLLKLDLSKITSSSEIKQMLMDRIANAKPGEWIIAEGWNENILSDKKIFHRLELDEISPDNPLVLKRVCRHAMIVNSKALELAGITKDTSNPPGGKIVKDRDGNPTGYLLDQAQELVIRKMPEVEDDYLETALTTALKDCLRLGLVGVHTEDLNYYSGFEKTYKAFLKVIDEKKIKFRTNLLVHHEVADEMHRLCIKYGDGTPFLTFGAMKIFADGALGARTALLSQPYEDSPETTGVPIHSKDQLKRLVQKARKYGMPVAIHAIGDLAFEWALEAIEEFPPVQAQRDRLIHAQILRKDLIEKAKHFPIVLDIQPHFVASDFPWVIERVGEKRIRYCYAWKTLLKSGIMCAGGSDAPIEPANPLLGIHAAITRKNPSGTVYLPEEKLTVFEAISLFTYGSAYAVQNERKQGLIEKGYFADFTILDRDPFQIQPDELLKTNVLMTVIDNTIMYKKA